jgi:hypothetical protein
MRAAELSMRAYVLATGAVFGLLVVLHVWRLTVETRLLHDPWYYLITGLALAFCAWAAVLVLRPRR